MATPRFHSFPLALPAILWYNETKKGGIASINTAKGKSTNLIKREYAMKEKIANVFLMSLRILASAWLSFLVSIVPLYIWRGTHPSDNFGEDLIMSVIGIIFGFFFLMLFQMRDDSSYRYSTRDTLLISSGGVGFYILLSIIVYLPTHNNYLIAVLGYHLSRLIGIGKDEHPTLLATLASALFFGVTCFLAILVGTKLAKKRQKRFLKDLKNK